ncbi:MAG TPA: class I SAM-dependent methyltransferase [Steroidobacteraceae bacterium]|nr:class I SAM-dependent methyltransferase [Steroidobacteraceae bacterium]
MSEALARFDRGYYRRYYFDPRTAVASASEWRARARLIAAFVDYLGLPLRSILDAGCGIGRLRAPLTRRYRKSTYVGLEPSEYLCGRYGWVQGRIEEYRAATPFDLVICYDVLQYLDDRAAARALANLARLSRAVLYFSALTRADSRDNCDRRRTDLDVATRPGEWYRARLRRGFRQVGAGFWLRRDAPFTLWELERAATRAWT